MDIKINGKRAKNLLSYEWIKIILSIVAGIAVWSLLFTTLGTRVTVGETFVFHVYENVNTVGSTTKNQSVLNEVKNKGYFSYDVLNTTPSTVMSGGQYSAAYMLSLKVTTQEGDVIIISDERANKTSEETQTETDLSNFVDSGYFCDIQTLLSSARAYCLDNGFITENQDGSYIVNEETIKKYFLEERIKSAGNYRKTYRTDAQKQKGANLEVERIKILYENYLLVTKAINKAIAEGKDFLWYGERHTYDSLGNIVEGKTEVKPYGIDLYKLNQPFVEEDETFTNIEKTWYTSVDGKTTAEGLVACVFDFRIAQPDLQYETLGFLRYIIETYSRYLENV